MFITRRHVYEQWMADGSRRIVEFFEPASDADPPDDFRPWVGHVHVDLSSLGVNMPPSQVMVDLAVEVDEHPEFTHGPIDNVEQAFERLNQRWDAVCRYHLQEQKKLLAKMRQKMMTDQQRSIIAAGNGRNGKGIRA